MVDYICANARRDCGIVCKLNNNSCIAEQLIWYLEDERLIRELCPCYSLIPYSQKFIQDLREEKARIRELSKKIIT